MIFRPGDLVRRWNVAAYVYGSQDIGLVIGRSHDPSKYLVLWSDTSFLEEQWEWNLTGALGIIEHT